MAKKRKPPEISPSPWDEPEPPFLELFRRHSAYPDMWVPRYYVFGAWFVVFWVFFFGSTWWTEAIAAAWVLGLLAIFVYFYFHGITDPSKVNHGNISKGTWAGRNTRPPSPEKKPVLK